MHRVRRLVMLGLAGLAAFLAVEAPAAATGPGDAFSWAFQNTGYQGTEPALAMRNGRVFPEIMFKYYDGMAHTRLITLLPVEGPTGTHWHQVYEGDGVVFNEVRGKSSADGRVAFVDGKSGGGLIGSALGGFTDLSPDVEAAAFDSAGGLVTVASGIVSGFPVADPPVENVADVAVSAFGEAIALYKTGTDFALYSPLTGQWTDGAYSPGVVDIDHSTASVTYDSLGVPHVVAYDPVSNGIVALDFDVPAGKWVQTVLASGLPGSGLPVPIDADSVGTVGTAFVRNGFLFHAYKRGVDPWTVVPVTSIDVQYDSPTGFAYDVNDFPVIAYLNGGQGIMLAHDPPVSVPEPATAAMGVIGAAALVRRRSAGRWSRNA